MQIHYIMGDCCGGVNPETGNPFFSYIIGFGDDHPRAPHHRSSSCLGDACDCSEKPHPYILYGAMVGGPDENDQYVDDCKNYKRNEVTTTYNSGLTSSVAAMKYFSMKGLLNPPAAAVDNGVQPLAKPP